MKQGSSQSAVAFVAFVVLLSAGVRLFRPDPAPVVPAETAGLDLAAYQAKAERALDAEKERQRPLAAGERIAVNRAGADELQRVPGVGASLAGRIVAERQKNGVFRATTDLTRVAGIGERTARELAKHLDFTGAGPGGPAAARSTSGARPSLAGPASRYDVPARPRGARAGVGSGQLAGAKASGEPSADGGAGARAVDVNRADAAELQRLRGIGPALARRIIAYRDSAGPFRSVDDLVAVPGIGPATLKRIRANVRVGG